MRRADGPPSRAGALALVLAAVAGASSACDLCSRPGPVRAPVPSLPGFRVCSACEPAVRP